MTGLEIGNLHVKSDPSSSSSPGRVDHTINIDATPPKEVDDDSGDDSDLPEIKPILPTEIEDGDGRGVRGTGGKRNKLKRKEMNRVAARRHREKTKERFRIVSRFGLELRSSRKNNGETDSR